MILDKIENLKNYAGCCLGVHTAVKFLQTHTLGTLVVGTTALENGVILNVYEYEPKEQSSWEVHRKYIDLQYLVKGDEKIGWCSRLACETVESYQPQTDVEFLTSNDPGTEIHLQAGQFAIFFPDDAHHPSLRLHSKEVKKLVFKLPVTEGRGEGQT